MIEIRDYNKNDYTNLLTLLKTSGLFDEEWDSEENINGVAKKVDDGVLLAFDKDTLVGSIFCIPYGSKTMFFFRLVVKENYRNQGIASHLLDTAQKMFDKKGYTEFGVFVDGRNSNLQNFYMKRNFTRSTKQWIYMYKNAKKGV